MSDEARRVMTEEEHDRFHLARKRGGMCAACGRVLADGEPVYVEPFAFWPGGGHVTRAYGPVGVECASMELRYDAERREPERCAGCGRPMHYREADVRRRRAICSRRCAARADRARWEAGT
jgi:hypothetical protein